MFTLSVVPAQCLGYTATNFWTRVSSLAIVIQLYAGKCTPIVDRALKSFGLTRGGNRTQVYRLRGGRSNLN